MKLASLLIALSLVVGCSAASEDVETTEESEGALSTSAQKVIGAYLGNGNAGAIDALILQPDGVFIIDLGNSIRCAAAPCPSNAERVKGTFSAGPRTITFRANDASDRASGVLGRFHYEKTEAGLTLTKGETTHSLDAVGSYCQQASDCKGQALLVPACVGQFTCTETSTCHFSCGAPPPDPCAGLDQADCQSKRSLCRPIMGPSSCSGGPRPICTRDFVFKSCEKR